MGPICEFGGIEDDLDGFDFMRTSVDSTEKKRRDESRRRRRTECPRHDLCGLFSNSKLGVVFHEVVGDHVAHDQVGVFDAAHVGYCYLDTELG